MGGVCIWWFSRIFRHLTLQAPPDGIQDIIWAFSPTPPDSADADVHISIHHFFGSSTLNLTRTAAAAAAAPEDEPVPSPVPSAEAGDSEDKVDADVGKTTGPVGGGGFAGFVHAGLCSLAFLLVIPSGALVVRYAKATGSTAAFDLHRYLQFGVGMCRVFGSRRPLISWLYCTPRIPLRFCFHRRDSWCGLSFGPFPSSPFTAGTSIAGGMLAYLFMDTDGSGDAHKVSEVKKCLWMTIWRDRCMFRIHAVTN